jgi:hypothetical protein
LFDLRWSIIEMLQQKTAAAAAAARKKQQQRRGCKRTVMRSLLRMPC